jgi:hypothetical protein
MKMIFGITYKRNTLIPHKKWECVACDNWSDLIKHENKYDNYTMYRVEYLHSIKENMKDDKKKA